MKTSRLRLRHLFDRYYNNTASQSERDELFAIIDAGQQDEELAHLISQTWDELNTTEPFFTKEKSASILSNITKQNESLGHQSKGSIIMWAKVAVAAMLIVCAGAAVFQQIKKRPAKQQVVARAKRPAHDALPGGNKAVLTLANGQTIVLDDAQNGTLAKQGATIIKKAADGQLVYNAAAAAETSDARAMNTIATPRGGQYQIILPDGSKVWLNAASSISFPAHFTGSSREVTITGEAYFEVTKNKAMPFRVKTNEAKIEVLGTHFNVMAYDDENVMKTTLLEGAVNISSGNFSAALKPGQQAQIHRSGQNRVVDDVDVDDETAWKNGIFQFRDAGIDVILRQASRWYDVDVTYKGKVPQREFTGHLSRNVRASELLKMLKYTGVNVEIEGTTIIVQ
ncbi:FecR family protein [Mucilaginibacter terrenus]|uniref:FecR family protein n=1 Tax=Mucilaginibacter terrenus TaxID=2482727 RepID=A0A3E2NW94_9SPHI|nr:FecR family protein [Mucilaginibacter terrenus]RFZ85283.1 FecR family protein [Mucilaginibacter terrenus]